ncbi:MAG: hypothetical protein COZ75_06300 [Flavobacteriaceae bacterium CG_4_8_14_3_um_filter_34_10]|nr:hypothetical protein [Flavobacteriia bacterium]OIP48924.1 MAG: hypothetical protein AUK33_11860 [Flavobacteriaceae bacterium CG2_30_34_30]PIQ17719.1 MAG: hypothetical protein COW66_09785 [Flavobacteriaceae bacterium CG18_big_fil_WC_8_21_14_2_50_34_36]PIV51449.1 MAG: hypothetical protein COS19_01055 [Flavobacteriaceae bacterium CG02_land_8_20_14_3_00_34_13]PIX09514.1 MAG: hypothetical protein COZ75_06300 [Flavobacteriaceae bacterium CG_4_8_14_3_um_filter_34_10]PIZ07762.1 MAG: hypothetical pr
MGSSNQNRDWLLQVYQSPRSVFGLADIALLTGESNPISLTKKLHYQIGKGNLKNPRKGLYAKPNYDPAALACTLYTPTYVSLDYVLQKEGIIFQYDSAITAVSYLSRALEIEGWQIKYRKIKDAVLLNTNGIISNENGIHIATKERAFLDMLYLNGNMYFDAINTLNKNKVLNLLPMYASNVLEKRVKKILKI